MTVIKNKNGWKVFVIIISVSAVLSHTYFFEVNKPDLKIYEKLMAVSLYQDWPFERYVYHTRIVEGTAKYSPNKYRILVPYICEFIYKSLYKIFPFLRENLRAFHISYAIYHFLVFCFLFISLFLWLKLWFSSEQALIGVLFVAGTITIAFRDHYYAPWSLLEVGLFSTSLIAIYRKQYKLLSIIIILASLNRETGVFIPLTFLFATLDEIRFSKINSWIKSKEFLLTCFYFFIWASIFFGLRFWLGWAPHVGSILIELRANLSPYGLFTTFKNILLFLGGFWIFMILGYKHAPDFVRRISRVIPFYLVPIYIWAPWWEVRLLMTMYPIFIALGLSFIYPARLKTDISSFSS